MKKHDLRSASLGVALGRTAPRDLCWSGAVRITAFIPRHLVRNRVSDQGLKGVILTSEINEQASVSHTHPPPRVPAVVQSR